MSRGSHETNLPLNVTAVGNNFWGVHITVTNPPKHFNYLRIKTKIIPLWLQRCLWREKFVAVILRAKSLFKFLFLCRTTLVSSIYGWSCRYPIKYKSEPLWCLIKGAGGGKGDCMDLELRCLLYLPVKIQLTEYMKHNFVWSFFSDPCDHLALTLVSVLIHSAV